MNEFSISGHEASLLPDGKWELLPLIPNKGLLVLLYLFLLLSTTEISLQILEKNALSRKKMEFL